MTSRRMLVAAALTAATALTLPAAAGAVTVTVTGDTGQPIPLSATAPTQIRNMHPSVIPSFSSTEKRFGIRVIGPDGASQADYGYSCVGTGISDPSETVNYLGNGTYTVYIKTSADVTDSKCAKAGAEQAFTFTIAAGTSVAAPAPRVLSRKPGSIDAIPYRFAVGVNPGASYTEVRYAPGATLAPDGGIVGTPSNAYVDEAGGFSDVKFYDPGTYTFVSRAVRGSATTAWSAPVTIQVLAPFDFVSEPYFSDSRGPGYAITGTLREKTARGRITVSIAKGRKGGKFHMLRKVKISKAGTFTVRFTQRHRGRYRIKYAFKGSATTAGGTVVQGIRIKRVRF